MKNINQGINTFNKAVQDFGDSMDKMTSELSSDIKKSNKEAEIREKKNKENLEKLWGEKKMRCKICQIPHKNTSRFQLWEDLQVCRLCSNVCDYFSWNGNYLQEYWSKRN